MKDSQLLMVTMQQNTILEYFKKCCYQYQSEHHLHLIINQIFLPIGWKRVMYYLTIVTVLYHSYLIRIRDMNAYIEPNNDVYNVYINFSLEKITVQSNSGKLNVELK